MTVSEKKGPLDPVLGWMYKRGLFRNLKTTHMSLTDKNKWDKKYAVSQYITGKEPCEWLVKNTDYLDGKGLALDIASGEGRNAVFVAKQGYQTLAIDVSTTGLDKANALAKEKGVAIKTIAEDLDHWKFKKNIFDLVLCFNFLDRKLFSGIKDTLKPGGLVFYETFSVDYLKYSQFKKEWVLRHNELLEVFREFRVLEYREVDLNNKAFASLVALKENDI